MFTLNYFTKKLFGDQVFFAFFKWGSGEHQKFQLGGRAELQNFLRVGGGTKFFLEKIKVKNEDVGPIKLCGWSNEVFFHKISQQRFIWVGILQSKNKKQHIRGKFFKKLNLVRDVFRLQTKDLWFNQSLLWIQIWKSPVVMVNEKLIRKLVWEKIAKQSNCWVI